MVPEDHDNRMAVMKPMRPPAKFCRENPAVFPIHESMKAVFAMRGSEWTEKDEPDFCPHCGREIVQVETPASSIPVLVRVTSHLIIEWP